MGPTKCVWTLCMSACMPCACACRSGCASPLPAFNSVDRFFTHRVINVLQMETTRLFFFSFLASYNKLAKTQNCEVEVTQQPLNIGPSQFRTFRAKIPFPRFGGDNVLFELCTWRLVWRHTINTVTMLQKFNVDRIRPTYTMSLQNKCTPQQQQHY